MARIQKRLDAERRVNEAETREVDEKRQYGRDWTVSIALPGSIIENAQSDELRTYLAGQVRYKEESRRLSLPTLLKFRGSVQADIVS